MAAEDTRDSRVAQVHDMLAQIGTVAGREETTQTAGGQYAPWDRQALLRRMQTFSSVSWFGKPASLSAAACAVHGWRNVRPDTLCCVSCGAKLVIRLPSIPEVDENKTAAAKYEALLLQGHDEGCPWRGHGCDGTLLSQPPAAPAKLQAGFEQRLQELQQLDRLPLVGASVLGRLASAAAGAGMVASLAAALCMDEHALQAAAAAAALPAANAQNGQAVAAPYPEAALPPAQAGAACTSITSEQRARLLALSGWAVQALPGADAASAASAPGSSVYGISHLRRTGSSALGSGGSAAPAPRVAASHATLGCVECGARVGLWSFCRTGPLYEKALHSKAFQLAQQASSSVAAERMPPAGGTPLTAPDVAPPGAARSVEDAAATASPAPAEGSPGTAGGLARTIAGGALAADSDATSSGPFGGGAAIEPVFGGSNDSNPVFGLGSFELEAQRQLKRAASTSPAEGSASPRAAPSGGEWAGAGPEGAAHASDAHGAQRTKVAGDSALEPALDPLASHRPWCPWLHAVSGGRKPAASSIGVIRTASSAAAAAPLPHGDAPAATAAATVGAGAKAAGVDGAGSELGSGWLYCLQAVAGAGGVGSSSVAGIPSAGGDYGLRVRQVLGVLRGALPVGAV